MKVWEAKEKLMETLMKLDEMEDTDNVYLFGGHIETAEDIINFQYNGLLKDNAKLDAETSELVIDAYGDALLSFDYSFQNEYIQEVLRGETKYNDVDIIPCLPADVIGDMETAKDLGWEGDNDEDDNTNDEDEV